MRRDAFVREGGKHSFPVPADVSLEFLQSVVLKISTSLMVTFNIIVADNAV